jgi:uncharacterized protein (DUF433 family)
MAAKARVKDRRGGATCLDPAEFLNRREAAMLADVSLRSVDKAIEEKVVRPSRAKAQATLIDRGDVLAIALFARAEVPLSRSTKRRINEWIHGFPSEEAFEETKELLLSDLLVLRLDAEFGQLAGRLRRYLERRKSHIDTSPEIQGGEPVITGTRLPVRSVAERLRRGDPIASLAEDYPGIPMDAFEAARVYAEAHPRRGRPARPWRDA